MTKMRPILSAKRSQQGLSLLEVLISVIVLSLGLLGLAGLQMNAVRNNQSSMERSMAVMESYSIIDAMRVDRDNAVGGGFNLAIDDNDPAAGSFAANELGKWRARLRELLGPGATGSVVCVVNNCTITVRWDDRRGTAGAQQHSIVTQALL